MRCWRSPRRVLRGQKLCFLLRSLRSIAAIHEFKNVTEKQVLAAKERKDRKIVVGNLLPDFNRRIRPQISRIARKSPSVFMCEIGGKDFFRALSFWVAGQARAGFSVVDIDQRTWRALFFREQFRYREMLFFNCDISRTLRLSCLSIECKLMNSTENKRSWRNWQTRMLQEHVG